MVRTVFSSDILTWRILQRQPLKHFNREAFLNDISQAPWAVVDVFTDIDDKVNAFIK